MAQPPGYTPSTDFSDEESRQVAGRSTIRTAALDAELAAIETTLDALLTNLALLQRDDTRLADGVVEPHTFSTAAKALVAGNWTPKGNWATGTAYSVGDVVEESGNSYVCAEAHTSGTFSTDHSAGRWVTISNAAASAAAVTFAPTSTLTSTDVQGAVTELDADVRPSADLFMHEYAGGV